MSNKSLEELNKLITTIGPDKISKDMLELLIKEYVSENQNDLEELLEADEANSTKSKKKKNSGFATRPLTMDEFFTIINLINNGFFYKNKNGKESHFRPQSAVAMALSLEANLGLRISDVLQLKVKDFQKDKLELIEKKTKKLQYRAINPDISDYVRDYALEHNIGLYDNIINVKLRWIQDRLKIVSTHLELTNIGTHSFRKFFATEIFNKTGDINLVKNLLNHSSISVTQRYLQTNQAQMDEASMSMNFLPGLKQ